MKSKFNLLLFCLFGALIFSSSESHAAGPWEEIVSIRSGKIFGRVDLHKRSFKKKAIQGDKILKFKT